MRIVEMKSRKDTYRTKAGVCEKETTTVFFVWILKECRNSTDYSLKLLKH